MATTKNKYVYTSNYVTVHMIYTGCNGTHVAEPGSDPDLLPALCYEEPQTGRCRAYIPSYYYDADVGECQEFIYGGCGGNENRFEDIDNCTAACMQLTPGRLD